MTTPLRLLLLCFLVAFVSCLCVFCAAHTVFAFSFCCVQLLAITCIYLASKCCEELLEVRDVITCARRELRPESGGVLRVGAEYHRIRESVIQAELLVLRILDFDTDLTTAHKELLHFLRALASFPLFREPGGDAQLRMVGQVAWTLASDLYLTRQCTLYPPAHLAVAALVVAVALLRLDLPPDWWLSFAPVTEAELAVVSASLNALYTSELPPALQPSEPSATLPHPAFAHAPADDSGAINGALAEAAAERAGVSGDGGAVDVRVAF